MSKITYYNNFILTVVVDYYEFIEATTSSSAFCYDVLIIVFYINLFSILNKLTNF